MFKFKQENRLSLTHRRVGCCNGSYVRLSGFFYHAGPTVWNSLPNELSISDSDSFGGFKQYSIENNIFSRY